MRVQSTRDIPLCDKLVNWSRNRVVRTTRRLPDTRLCTLARSYEVLLAPNNHSVHVDGRRYNAHVRSVRQFFTPGQFRAEYHRASARDARPRRRGCRLQARLILPFLPIGEHLLVEHFVNTFRPTTVCGRTQYEQPSVMKQNMVRDATC
jgi:hypothetical protein